MNILFNILAHSIGCIFAGVLIAISGIALMFFIIRSWWKDSDFSPISILVGGILFVFLSFQAILICGAITIKSYSDDLEEGINSIVENMPQDRDLKQSERQQILDNINKECPLAGYYVNQAYFQGYTSANIAESMVNELNSYMNWFILRRLGWCLLFVVIGASAVIKSLSSHNGGRNTRKPYTVSEDVF